MPAERPVNQSYKKFNLSNFSQPSFLSSSNIYAVNLRQYSGEGSFNAFAKQLPRLQRMGVEILWFMPIHPIGKLKRKGSLGSYYSIADFRGVNPEFGSKDDFKHIIKTAHDLGMKVIMDWVANHAAWDNVWTNTNPEFFVRDEAGNFKPPYDWDDVIQIDHNNTGEQQAMVDAMLYWIENFDIDGFRADLAHLTPLEFWMNARVQASTLKNDLIWLAETEDIPYHHAFDISFTWRWMHATEEYCKGQKDFSALTDTLEFYKNDFPSDAVRMWFTSNHDENSWNGTAFEKYGEYVKALSVFNCTYYGIPLIYSGEESGLDKRLKFFDKDPINWNEPSEWENFYSLLLALRKRSAAIAGGLVSFPVLIPGAAEKNMLAFYRKNIKDTLLVFINMSKEKQIFSFDTADLKGNYENIFTYEKVWLNDGGLVEIEAAGFIVLQGVEAPNF
ncbi:MAG: 1,4-alpha-glucan branching protein [Rhizobacter sp.]|nr:1,4-alpha-glucan branching protein [Ferruginibacter sp.]